MSWVDLREFRAAGSLGQAPSPRNFHTSTLIDQRLFIIGGTNGNQFFDDVFTFDIAEMRWTKQNPSRTGGARSAMTPRSRHTAVAIRKNIVIFGGVFAGFGKGTGGSDVYVLDTENMRWIRPKVSGRVPQARFAHCAAAVDKSMYVFAGHDGARSLNDLYVFNTAKNSWMSPQSLPGTVPPPSHNYVMTAVSKDLYIMGGEAGFDTVYRLRLGGDMCWDVAACAGARPTPRHQFTASLVPSGEDASDSVYVFGGGSSGGQLYNDTFVLHVDAEGVSRWSKEPVAGTVPPTRIGHSMNYFTDGARRLLIIFGGSDRQTFLDDLYFLDLDALMSFRAVPTSGLRPPPQRVGHSATLISTPGQPARVLVYGGDSTSTVLADVHVLRHTTTGGWAWDAPRHVEGSTPPRVSHSAVFVPGQRKVYVFGGGDLKSCTNQLWSLDVSRDRWRWDDLTNKTKGTAPSARAGHAAALLEDDGEQHMFVIGGFSEREYRADVFRLDLTPGRSMTWEVCMPTVTGGLETLRGKMMTPRLGHSVSVIKQRFYIFGGSLRGSALDNDLFEFTPVPGAYSWQKLVVHGEPPSKRFGHVASVIEGTRPRLFIVGGLGAPRGRPELMNDVHVFDVETSTWSEPRIKGRDSFDPRCRHAAVVGPDHDLLIFGGCLEADSQMQVWSLTTDPDHMSFEEGETKS